MDKYENMDNFNEREHVLEIKLQLGEHKGTLRQIIGGNCFGYNILTCFDPKYFVPDDFIYNDCELELIGQDDEGQEWFKCILTDDNGDVCEYEDLVSDFGNIVVKLEIIECKIVD